MTEQTPSKTSRPIARKLLATLLVFVGLMALIYLERAPILAAVARAWIVNEPVSHADVIAIIGGGLQTRTFAAAKMYRQGICTNILLASSKLSPTDRMGVTQPERSYSEKILITNG